jgi:predicted lipid-binding transport protein (Tim44 family)
MKLWTVLLASALAFGAMDADAARRLGGGSSFGRQSSNVTQRQASPPAAPAAPANVQPQRSPAAQPGSAVPTAQPARRPWAGMLGGLAAGLGLAWLAHTLGFGAEFGQFLLFALLAVVIMAVIGVIRSRRQQQQQGASGPGYAYQGAGATADAPVSLREYNPAKVGNDASARPWESTFGPEHQAGSGLGIGSALQNPRHGLGGSQTWGIPAGFDTEGFLTAAKRNFVTLQGAWDGGDMATLRAMMNDEMLGEIRKQIGDRDRQPPPTPQRTEVVMLEAQLLGIEELPTEYMASVEFSGLIREEPSAGPAPFREVWNMIKPKDGTAGWLVAGVQALQ